VEFMPIFSVDESGEDDQSIDYPDSIPLVALKNTVLFPGIIIPITISRPRSLKAIRKAFEGDRLVGVLSQIDHAVEDPEVKDLYHVGTVAKLVKMLKMPDGNMTAILQGKRRFQLDSLTSQEPFLYGEISILQDVGPNAELEFEAIIASIRDRANKIIELSPNLPKEARVVVKNIKNDQFLLNFIASNLGVNISAKQDILEVNDTMEKAEAILQLMDSELQMLELRNQIESKVRIDLEKQQRDYFLNQQLKTIQEELGQGGNEKELNELAERARKMKWSKEVGEHFGKELAKAKRMNPAVAEYSVQLNYLELFLDLPWGVFTKDHFNLRKAKDILDRDHCGLEKVKDRILEHLAVLKLKGDMKAPILCLVGPPGVGKTSLGKSIAQALKRKYVRMSLGGLHDESEVRGHRKTYIGAMPGRILQSLKKVKSANPVFILDEIDKVGKDFRGDPSSALLEVLDPEQNATFYDNYLEMEFDLSNVMFIATANSLSTIQPALLDRMEIIQVSGYSNEEKVEIAQKHLVPDQRQAHGLTAKQVQVPAKVVATVIKDYTRESGVRELNRKIGGVMRGVAKKVAMEEKYSVKVKDKDLYTYLGPVQYNNDMYQEQKVAGVTVGLAWTSVGGDILFVEASTSKGKGQLTLTGNLGDVMKESATTALSFLKSNCDSIGLSCEEFDKYNVHVHVPQGAIPKDGPSAGITMLTSLASAFTNRPVKPYLAMTGEITLRGKVLPVGGIKEKILAAKRAGIKEIILCKDNEKDIKEIKAEYLEGLAFIYVSKMQEVLQHALDF
ncbi:MAG: endopeptidase La, partial [Bacteroidota bacterium]